jgi:DNA-binding response OmpR family regulator
VKRLLLIEDEPGLVLTLRDRLTREGYALETSSDGESGLERAAREPFDLVLLDVMLPRLIRCASRAAQAWGRNAGHHAHRQGASD